MKLSKFKALWSLCTGGWSGLAVYILEVINKWLKTLNLEKIQDFAKIVATISSLLSMLVDSFIPEKYRAAAKLTIAALNALASAMSDGEITKEELDSQIDCIEAAIKAWKEV